MPSNERSAEWLRVAIEVLETWGSSHYESIQDALAEYRALLAAAEARETPAPEVIPGTREALAGLTIRPQVPTAAEVIEAAEATLTAIAARCVPLGEDSGDTGTVIIAEAGLAAIARWKEANGDSTSV